MPFSTTAVCPSQSSSILYEEKNASQALNLIIFRPSNALDFLTERVYINRASEFNLVLKIAQKLAEKVLRFV